MTVYGQERPLEEGPLLLCAHPQAWQVQLLNKLMWWGLEEGVVGRILRGEEEKGPPGAWLSVGRTLQARRLRPLGQPGHGMAASLVLREDPLPKFNVGPGPVSPGWSGTSPGSPQPLDIPSHTPNFSVPHFCPSPNSLPSQGPPQVPGHRARGVLKTIC